MRRKLCDITTYGKLLSRPQSELDEALKPCSGTNRTGGHRCALVTTIAARRGVITGIQIQRKRKSASARYNGILERPALGSEPASRIIYIVLITVVRVTILSCRVTPYEKCVLAPTEAYLH